MSGMIHRVLIAERHMCHRRHDCAGAPGLRYIYPELLLQPGAWMALMPDHTEMDAKDGAMHVEITGNQSCAGDAPSQRIICSP